MQAATRVGLLVVAFLALLYGAYAVLGRTIFGRQTSTYFADFQDAGGATTGTKVLMAGVQVGTVSEVRLLSPHQARLTLEVDSETRIPASSTALLGSSLIALGEQPIEIIPPAESTAYLQPGGVLAGRRQGPLEGIMPDSKETIAELNKTLIATRKLLEDQELRQDVKQLLTTTDRTLEEFGKLATQTQGMMAENRLAIRTAIHEATLAMQEIRRGTEAVARIVSEGKLEAQTLALLERLNSAGERAEKLMTSLNDLVNDPNVREPLNTTLANTAEITEKGKVIADNAVKASAAAVDLAEEAKVIAGDVRTALNDVRGFFGRAGRGRSLGISASMDVLRDSQEDYWRTDVELSAPIPGGRAHLGMWDAFESNKLIAQISRPAGPNLSFRYGIFAAKPGLGVEYRPADGLLLRGDFFDINDPRFDLRARFELGKGLYGWLGVNRVLDQSSPTIGIGLQK